MLVSVLYGSGAFTVHDPFGLEFAAGLSDDDDDDDDDVCICISIHTYAGM